MAKKRRSAKAGRDDPQQSLAPLPLLIPQFAWVEPEKQKPKPQLESDRRRYNPTRSIAPLTPKNASRIVVKNRIEKAVQQYRRAHLLLGSPVKYARRKAAYSTLSERLSFNAPKRLELCIRRAIRKEVMHAKKKAGKVGQKRPNRNFWSAISCRR